MIVLCLLGLTVLVGVTSAAPPDPVFYPWSQQHWERDPYGALIEFSIKVGMVNNGGPGNVFYRMYRTTTGGEQRYSSKVFAVRAGEKANITTHFPHEISGFTLLHHEIRPAQPGDADYGDVTIFYPDAPPSVTLTSFSSGGEVYTSHLYRIRWDYTGDPGSTVRLELQNGGGVSLIIAEGVEIGHDGSGSYDWNIPAGLAPGSNYRIRIISAKTQTDTSDTVFTIRRPSITLTSPDGGEVLERGKNTLITWTYENEDSSRVRIDLYKDGAPERVIAINAPIGSGGTGSYAWMPEVYDAVGSTYTIHLSSSGATDESGSAFSISNPAALAVHSPNGGETWYTGDQNTIEWFYPSSLSGSTGMVELLESGTIDRVICDNLGIYPDGYGFCSWDIPEDLAAGNDYTIRVSLGSSPADTSDAVFTIRDPFISVTAPPGGGVWEPGSVHEITWDFGGIAVSENVRIDLLRSGTLYQNLHTGYPIPMKRYVWSIPAGQAEGNDYTIRLTASSGETNTSGVFTIGVPPLEADFTAGPRSGAAPLTVTFTDRSTRSPTSWRWLFGDGSPENATRQNPVHTFTRPGTYSVSLNVSAAGEYSRLTKPRYITVTSPVIVVVPDGGERWAQGSDRIIRWNYTGDPGSAVRIDLLKGTRLNRMISAAAPVGSRGSGTFRWKVPYNQAPGPDYRIRITSTGTAIYTDTSNASFTIRAGAPLTVTVPNGGQVWNRGSARTIAWSYTGNPGSFVRIELLKGGTFSRVISFNTSVGAGGSGSRTWGVPAGQAPGSDYRIRVTSLANRFLNDTSNADFTISA